MAEKTMRDIAELFEKMKFRKKIFGGVDERDVWRKLETVQKEYRSLYEAREAKYRVLLKINGIDPNLMDAKAFAGEENDGYG